MAEAARQLSRQHYHIPASTKKKPERAEWRSKSQAYREYSTYLRVIDMVADIQYIVVRRRWIEETDHLKVGRRPLNVKIGGRTQSAAG